MKEDEIYILLEDKWISPIVLGLEALSAEVLDNFTDEIKKLGEKYQETYQHVAQAISVAENDISSMIDELEGDDYDSQGLEEFQSLLRGEMDG